MTNDQREILRAIQIPQTHLSNSGEGIRRRIKDAMVDRTRELIGRYFGVSERVNQFFLVEDNGLFGITHDNNRRGYVFIGEVFPNSAVRYGREDLKIKMGVAMLDYVSFRSNRRLEMEFVDHIENIAGFSWGSARR